MMFLAFRVRQLSRYDAKIGKKRVTLAKIIRIRNAGDEEWMRIFALSSLVGICNPHER